ncbi:RsbRD N-terminal domain-containing protein [Thermodesulfobacteriota bacterium]
MSLETILSENKSKITKKWYELIIESYPKESRGFFKREKNKFANPVGQTIALGIESLFGEMLKGSGSEKLAPHLDEIIKIRAIQDFIPSKALGFVLQLKGVLREILGKDGAVNGFKGELEAFEKRIDDTALLAFDIYSQRVKKLYELRVNEINRQVSRLLVRANLVCEIPEEEREL